MNLTEIHTEVLNMNLKPAAALSEALYEQSQCNGRMNIPLSKRRAQLKQLSILLDDINGVIHQTNN